MGGNNHKNEVVSWAFKWIFPSSVTILEVFGRISAGYKLVKDNVERTMN